MIAKRGQTYEEREQVRQSLVILQLFLCYLASSVFLLEDGVLL